MDFPYLFQLTEPNMKLQKQNIEIFLVSFVILFLEVVLIRWISTEIRIFAYFNNLVLLACFLGIGFGCFFSIKKPNLSITILLLAILFILIKMPWIVNIDGKAIHLFRGIPLLLSAFTDSIIWFEAGGQATVWKAFLGILFTLILSVS